MFLCTFGVYQDLHVQLSKKVQLVRKLFTIEIFTERFICGSMINDYTVELMMRMTTTKKMVEKIILMLMIMI